jgi:hypothetical protein
MFSIQQLGAVYTCDFAYDSVYDLLPKVPDLFFLKCVDWPLVLVFQIKNGMFSLA